MSNKNIPPFKVESLIYREILNFLVHVETESTKSNSITLWAGNDPYDAFTITDVNSRGIIPCPTLGRGFVVYKDSESSSNKTDSA